MSARAELRGRLLAEILLVHPEIRDEHALRRRAHAFGIHRRQHFNSGWDQLVAGLTDGRYLEMNAIGEICIVRPT